jgi:hypothetical protein
MKALFLLLSATALVTIVAAPAAARPGSTERSGAHDLAPPAPAGRSEQLLDGVEFELSISGDEPSAAVQYGRTTVRNRFDAEGAGKQLSESWAIRLSMPVGGSNDLTSGKTLNALADGPKATFTYSIFGFESAAQNFNSPRFKAIMRDARLACERTASTEEAKADCRNAGPSQEFAEEHSSYSTQALARALFSSMWRVGVEASVGLNRFEYFDAGLVERNKTKPQYAAAVFGAFYPAGGLSAGILKAEYQRAYEAADETILCKPVITNPAADCVKGSPAAPGRVERLNLSTEFRQVFPIDKKGAALAVSPKGTIDALSGDYSVELPVYYIPTWDLPISPGASLSYSSDKDKVSFGLFLKASFTLGD